MKPKTTIIIPSFLAEIITEILLKLPVKPLLRCKSVCKEWYSLISDQHFIKSHYKLSSTSIEHHRIIYNTFKARSNLISCPLYDVLLNGSVANNALLLENPLQQTPSRGFRIVGSCNGLMCLYSENSLSIYNPSTRLCHGVPTRRRRDSKPEWYSFGYDETNDDYKIVELAEICLKTRPCYIIKARIYSLKSGNWKYIDDFRYEEPLISCGVFSNGALHWVTAYHDSPETQRIVSLDLAKESYGEVLLFEYDEDDTKVITLGVFGEWLFGLCCYHSRHADLWVMKVYGVKDSWTKLVSLRYLMDELFDEYVYPVPLFVSYEGKVLLNCDSDLVIYESEDSSYEVIHSSHEACVIVVESLVSPFPPLAPADDNEN